MTTDTKAVARFEFTPCGMVEVLDGGYVLYADHEVATTRLRESIYELISISENLDEFSSESHWAKFDTALARVSGEMK